MWKYLNLPDVPQVCRQCTKLEYDYPDEYSPSVYYCALGLGFPTKKNTCKKQRRRLTRAAEAVRRGEDGKGI